MSITKSATLLPVGEWMPGAYLAANMITGKVDRDYGWLYAGLAVYQLREGSLSGRSPPVFRLIHCGTGHCVCIIEAHKDEAFAIAGQISRLGDWNFDGLDGWKNRDPELQEKLLDFLYGLGKKVSRGSGNRSHEAACAVALARDRAA